VRVDAHDAAMLIVVPQHNTDAHDF